jgi:uncharacterized RDD family membrane protein YckC
MSSPGEAHAGDRVAVGRIPSQTTVAVAPDSYSGPPTTAVRAAPAVVLPAASAPPRSAGVVTRLLAAAVDAVAVVALAALLDLGAAGARFLWSPMDFRWPHVATPVLIGVLLAVAVAYLAAGWALAGRTYGSKLMGLRVLSTRHGLLGWTRSILRALVCVLWPVGLLWCAVSRTRRSVADLVLATVVVYDARPYLRAPDGS